MAWRPGRRRLRLLPDLVLLAGVVAVAAWSRLQMLPFLTVSPDSVDPMLRASQILHGGSWLPPGHGPQFGPALYWLHLPYVIDATTLRECFGRMLGGQATTALIAFLALRVGLSRLGSRGDDAPPWPARLGAMAAATAIACAHGPRLALAHTYETYQAPMLAAAAGACAFLALSGRRPGWLALSFALIPLAVMVHPMAICLAPGAVLLAVPVVRRHGGRSLVPALAVAALVAVPGLIQALRVVLESPEGLSALGAVATSASGGSEDGLAGLRDILATFARPELPPLGPALLLAPVTALAIALIVHRRSRDRADRALAWFAGWATLVQLSLLGAALAIGYLQPYHLRILLPLAAMQLGVLVARLAALTWRWLSSAAPVESGPGLRAVLGLAASAVLIVLLGFAAERSVTRWADRLPRQDDLDVHLWLYHAISVDSSFVGEHWVEILSLGGRRSAWGYGPGVVMQELDCVRSPRWFSADGDLYLVVHGPRTEREAVERMARSYSDDHVRPALGHEPPDRLLLQFNAPARSRDFTAALCESFPDARARNDAWKYLDRRGELAGAGVPEDWFDPCIFRE